MPVCSSQVDILAASSIVKTGVIQNAGEVELERCFFQKCKQASKCWCLLNFLASECPQTQVGIHYKSNQVAYVGLRSQDDTLQ